jgi:hypothetical protein
LRCPQGQGWQFYPWIRISTDIRLGGHGYGGSITPMDFVDIRWKSNW